MSNPNIVIPVDLTNPGQFFACCGLLELAGRVDPDAEGWFDAAEFHLRSSTTLADLVETLLRAEVTNTMSAEQMARWVELPLLIKQGGAQKAALEDEKKALEALRREEPILLRSSFTLRVDWFRDEDSGGARFKTWAGRQSVLEITQAMHAGMREILARAPRSLWTSLHGGKLPFNFDSDLGGQGSALDIGFSFDPLADNATTKIEGKCKPALEILAFIGLQRFRPRENRSRDSFVYAAWHEPLSPSVAAAATCQAIGFEGANRFRFRLLYRTKYLKSFLPAQPFKGVDDDASFST